MTRAAAIALLLPFALAGWAGAAAPVAAAPVQTLDDTGAIVTLSAPARRIVSLAPSATELLFAAGAGARVIGVSETSDWPPAARALPRVGNARAIDLERIVALSPDLVVTWPYTAPGQVERLRERGIAVFVTDPKTIDGIAADLERLGALLGTSARTKEVAGQMRARLGARQRASAGERALAVFYEIWPSPLFTIGGTHLISQAIEVCGGANVFAALTLPAPTVGVEAVLAAKPDAIIAAADDGLRPDWLDQWRRWPTLPAVAHDNLLVVDGNLLHRPGPRFLDGVDALCAALDTARARMAATPPRTSP
jgi:iron complex transport system substrate-binding protein